MSVPEKREEFRVIGISDKDYAEGLVEGYRRGLEIVSEGDTSEVHGDNESLDIYMTVGAERDGIPEYDIHFDVIQRYPPSALRSITRKD